LPAELTNGELLRYGFPAEELAASRRLLREPNLPPSLIPIHRREIVWTFIARGAWDSALVHADNFARMDTAWAPSTEPYRVAVLGALFGGLDESAAADRRPAAAAAAARAPTASGRYRQLYWDGLLAAARRDSAGIATVRAKLKAFGDTVEIDQVLGAFELHRRGDTRGAAALLWAEELRAADLLYPNRRDAGDAMFGPVNRLVLSQWYAAVGDTAAAVSVLNYFDQFRTESSFDAAATLASLATLQKARLADGQRKCGEAKRDYEEFRRRYDLPVAKHQHLVNESSSALERLSVCEPRCAPSAPVRKD
jgi:hypothetical protein